MPICLNPLPSLSCSRPPALQLGHQAANCTTGTVNWRAMYGENAFVMRPAVFQSDIEAAQKAKQIDFEDLEKRARDYAKVRGCGLAREPPSRVG